MPKYTFKCHNCGSEAVRYVPASIEQVECTKCPAPMFRELPVISGSPEVKETIDSYTGVQHNQDHDQMVKDRHEQYYWEVEVPRLVQKYSLEASLENKWLVYNEKGELVINKPPSKR